MSDMNDWNKQIIDEFHATGGSAGAFEGATLVLLHTTGAKSGQERTNPLVAQLDGDDVVVFASKGGAPTNPDWYHNVLANPHARIELGTDTIDVQARVAEGEERERLWSRQKELHPGFAEYEKATTRQIPVVVLERS
jgi:deazaflavin-dependent oxidoreductase (nitroreductase family)